MPYFFIFLVNMLYLHSNNDDDDWINVESSLSLDVLLEVVFFKFWIAWKGDNGTVTRKANVYLSSTVGQYDSWWQCQTYTPDSHTAVVIVIKMLQGWNSNDQKKKKRGRGRKVGIVYKR